MATFASAAGATTPKEHIEHLRRSKFSIGGPPNPLTEDLHQAVKNLSAELYAKDVHFLMELIQNAEDNEYPEGVKPSLEFVITSRDITATGALATLLIFNNEKGFAPRNIDSICSVGRSTKKGNRKQGYIGEKGIGFKSVFLITAQPYIFSNGYQIRFSEEPCPHCNVGFIVPEWVDENPNLSDVKSIYGSEAALPTTTIILPLKPDKIYPVKQQLSSLHPEVLLFLSKIKRLSVKEDSEDPSLSTVKAIAISSETNFAMRKNIDAESCMLHLSAEESPNESGSQCSYYMWKQKFPVRPENKVEKRMEVEELLITLALPLEDRPCRGTYSPGIYAFLPTEMVTNFPFIIQADFILASSRETILLDDKWNQGILDCVPSAFISAFSSLVKTTESAPMSSLPPMFRFLPVNVSPYQKLNTVRDCIKAKLIEKDITPSEPHTEQKLFHRPLDVGRLVPAFWSILKEAKEQGVSLHNLSSHGKFILCSSFDSSEYDAVLNFLVVQQVGHEWYAKFIGSSNLIRGVSENLYLELLLFISDNWESMFHGTSMRNLPLVKYADLFGNVSLCSINKVATSNNIAICVCRESSHVGWLIDWNREFRGGGECYFMPASTQEAIQSCSHKERLLKWLERDVKVARLNVCEYAAVLCDLLKDEGSLVLACAHFFYHSLSEKHISESQVKPLCGVLPLLDNYGRVIKNRSRVLVPGKGSKWAALMGSNPWSSEGYVELAEDYLQSGHFAGQYTPEKQLMQFLTTYAVASDIPCLCPPNSVVPAVSGPLTKQNSFLLLDWLRTMKYKGISVPEKFLKCIKEGSWLKITLSGCPGYRPPSESFFHTSSWGSMFQNGAVLVDIPLIDFSFYGSEIANYKPELEMVGVMFEYGEACEYIGKHLMSLAASASLTRSNVFSILKFIKFLRENYLSPEKFISSINQGRWLRTSCGDRPPVQSVLFDEEWSTASQISNIPFVDHNFYGEEIYHFEEELKLLGVVVGFENRYELVINYLKPSTDLHVLNRRAFVLMLQCLQSSNSGDKIVNMLQNKKCLKTNLGYKYPAECFLPDPEWGSLLHVFPCFPMIDLNFYGNGILSYRREMKQLGVATDFDKAKKAFCQAFRQRASSCSLTKENALAFLPCYRLLTEKRCSLSDLKQCVTEAKWLCTRLGDARSPKDCILYSPGWKSVSKIARLPFLNDRDSCYGQGIHEYKNELKRLGVVDELQDGVEFVIAGLCLPRDLGSVTRTSMLALLDCIRIYLEKKSLPLPDSFFQTISRKWIKTRAGYCLPNECCLYTSKWALYLQQDDGPFVDEEFYGNRIADYRNELNAMGVVVDPKEGCPLLVRHLGFQFDMEVITRIYSFLRDLRWEPEKGDPQHIWIPNDSEQGLWASAEKCVLHDKDGLFSQQLHVLD
ncbi:uncharacterized protein LOC116188983 [Punica granatum]|uniref:Uncharacterized protein LOC116188983 n=1 Tax=Punica granatum TaxID=22663 RepID=A0A6P8BYP4_PUNGR|nr:uncharacterized protein LOC116188983 [Punica granatum]